MTQEHKELLLKDLCSRLPYHIKVYDKNGNFNTSYVNLLHINGNVSEAFVGNGMQCRTAPIDEIKPYLFPLSSMTEEQWNNAPRANLTNFTFESLKCGCFTLASYTCENDLYDLVEFINWLIENHFDIYGLIPLGLALDATNLNIY